MIDKIVAFWGALTPGEKAGLMTGAMQLAASIISALV